ncbi:GNAT family N-acetyltransferase [Actinocatenispora rupis]|uniref:N-acetyltransferase n=1 Tax=Actinocatenispora rupis TaxID=519421 RepID=A0A8J3JIV3_9ACTN|nr:GNAT family N-acetyltransferase [Actinocatenispora rupis]GID15783.1 N-acetyltransferase [Actinocatenispora rupis]
MTSTVVDRPDTTRYEIRVDDATAGFVEYHLFRDEIAFLHTEIDPAYEGKGLGSQLARYVLDAARERHLAVLPYCPFIRGWMTRHPEYLDLVPDGQRARFGL